MQLLGCPEGILQSALQNKTIEAKGEKVENELKFCGICFRDQKLHAEISEEISRYMYNIYLKSLKSYDMKLQ